MKSIIKQFEDELLHESLLGDINESDVGHEGEFVAGLLRQVAAEERERGIPFTLEQFQDYVGQILENDPAYSYGQLDADQLIGVLWQKYQSNGQPQGQPNSQMTVHI